MSDLVFLVVPFIIAMGVAGIGVLIWGVVTIRNPPRSQHALDGWLKRMKAVGSQHIAQSLTSDQFERDTLVALARYQRRIQGTMLCGMGGGIVVGSIAAIGAFAALYHFYANVGDSVLPAALEILGAIIWLGVIPGTAVSAFLVATTGARSPRPSLPVSARRVSKYRSPWFFWLNCLMFLLSAVLPTLIITNTAPKSLYPSTPYGQPPQVGLLVLASSLIAAIILLAEIVSRLLVRYPLPDSDLSPAVEAQLLPTLPAVAICLVWGQLAVMSVFFLLSSEALSVPVFSLMLLAPVLGIPYILVGMIHFALHTEAAQAPMARAVALAAKPQGDAQGG